jgi:hypothetical protein
MAPFAKASREVAKREGRGPEVVGVLPLDELLAESVATELAHAETAGEILEGAAVSGVPENDVHGWNPGETSGVASQVGSDSRINRKNG